MEEKLAEIIKNICNSTYIKSVNEKYSKVSKFSDLELSVIKFIAEKGNVKFKDITSTLNVPKSTLTNLINRLEKQEVLLRQKNPDDKRSYLLTLTEKGKDILTLKNDMENEIYSKMLANLSNKDKKRFIKTLNKIANEFNS